MKNDERLLCHKNDVLLLASQLEKYGKRRIITKNELFYYASNEPRIVLLRSGFFSVYHSHSRSFYAYVDNTEIVGLANIFHHANKFYLRSEVDHAEVIHLSVQDAVDVINSQNLWMLMSKIVTHYTQRYIDRDLFQTSAKLDELICSEILNFSSFPDFIRKHKNLSDYIILKTAISRSKVMSMLAALAKAGIIRIQKGRLLEVDERLMKAQHLRIYTNPMLNRESHTHAEEGAHHLLTSSL